MGLTNLNISHVANDDLTLCISRCLANLITLDMSSSTVTDKGIRYLAGTVNSNILFVVKEYVQLQQICDLSIYTMVAILVAGVSYVGLTPTIVKYFFNFRHWMYHPVSTSAQQFSDL